MGSFLWNRNDLANIIAALAETETDEGRVALRRLCRALDISPLVVPVTPGDVVDVRATKPRLVAPGGRGSQDGA